MLQEKLEIVAEPGERTITTRRQVDAPRSLVFEVFTKAEHLVRWMGPRGMTMEVEQNDLRAGGRYRFVHRTADGKAFAFHGVYREIVAPARVVRTFAFGEMADADGCLETLTLEERDGGTLIQTVSLHQTVEGRDRHLGRGAMESGMTEGYSRLDSLLVELQAR